MGVAPQKKGDECEEKKAIALPKKSRPNRASVEKSKKGNF